jgi:uncharacterized membrane protein YeaQ/YmgE (transglycosylase-associated protein family)
VGILAWILLGLIAGWLASLIMGGNYGILGNILLGIVGALVGGFLSSVLLGLDVSGFNVTSVLISVLGAIVVIGLARALTPGRRAL